MSGGLLAPDGYLWCRGGRPDATWHLVPAAGVAHQGTPRATARSVCGLWASLQPGHDGWAEVSQRAAPEPRRMCVACLAVVAKAQQRDRLVAPQTTQGKLPL